MPNPIPTPKGSGDGDVALLLQYELPEGVDVDSFHVAAFSRASERELAGLGSRLGASINVLETTVASRGDCSAAGRKAVQISCRGPTLRQAITATTQGAAAAAQLDASALASSIASTLSVRSSLESALGAALAQLRPDLESVAASTGVTVLREGGR